MLGSLRARLIVSFGLVVALAVFLAGAGALFLLRDTQQSNARERYGRLVQSIDLTIESLESGNRPLSDLKNYMDDTAALVGGRTILLDSDLQVVYDSAGKLDGKYVLSFQNPRLKVEGSNGARYQWANYNGDGRLTLFAAPPRERGSSGPNGFTPATHSQPLIAIPQSQLASAWLDLAPRLAAAGAIALVVSFIVSFFISRSISGPLRRITQASVQMSHGNYDVHIPIRGEDEIGRLAEAFNAMATEVSRSQRTMKDLLANVSHELKTPLTSIQGFSQAILDGSIRDRDQFTESGRIINEEATRMRALVDDLLLLSQIESGQVEMEHAHVDLSALLERMLARFQWAIRGARIKSGLSVGHVPLVHGDERRLEQVFSNLIDNAVRHTPPDGTINVTAEVQRNGYVSVGVHNSGSVIPEEDLPRVFERFFQVDRARARKGGSSGLGLAIVAEIVEAHGGTVRAVSGADRGTEFIVTLPPASVSQARNGRGVAAKDPSKPQPVRSAGGATTPAAHPPA